MTRKKTVYNEQRTREFSRRATDPNYRTDEEQYQARQRLRLASQIDDEIAYTTYRSWEHLTDWAIDTDGAGAVHHSGTLAPVARAIGELYRAGEFDVTPWLYDDTRYVL
jgi:hypothetical protein